MGELDRMTVGELRAALASYDQDALVLVDGYEGGYENPEVREERIKLEREPSYTMGPYSEADADEDGETAVIVSRTHLS